MHQVSKNNKDKYLMLSQELLGTNFWNLWDFFFIVLTVVVIGETNKKKIIWQIWHDLKEFCCSTIKLVNIYHKILIKWKLIQTKK